MMLREDKLDEDLLKNTEIFHFGTLSIDGRGCEKCKKENGALDRRRRVLEYGLENFDEQKLRQMLLFVNAAASIVTTRKGALRVMPTKEEVEALINNQ